MGYRDLQNNIFVAKYFITYLIVYIFSSTCMGTVAFMKYNALLHYTIQTENNFIAERTFFTPFKSYVYTRCDTQLRSLMNYILIISNKCENITRKPKHPNYADYL